MSNIQKYAKKNRQSSGVAGFRFANTQHLKRILIFLRLNPLKYYTRTDIKSNCCMDGYAVMDGLKFLVRERFVTSQKGDAINNKHHDVQLFSIDGSGSKKEKRENRR